MAVGQRYLNFAQLLLFCQLTLMLIQRCRSVYNYQAPHLKNHAINDPHHPMKLRNGIEIYNPRVNFRRHEDSSSHYSGSSEDCVCSCDECNNPEPCCRDFCENHDRTSAPGGNTHSNIHPTRPESDVVVIPYAVPVLIFPIKTAKSAAVRSTNNTEENSKDNGPPDSKTRSTETSTALTTASPTDYPVKETQAASKETPELLIKIETTSKIATARTQKITTTTKGAPTTTETIITVTEEATTPTQHIETTTDDGKERLLRKLKLKKKSFSQKLVGEKKTTPKLDKRSRFPLPYHIPRWITRFE